MTIRYDVHFLGQDQPASQSPVSPSPVQHPHSPQSPIHLNQGQGQLDLTHAQFCALGL